MHRNNESKHFGTELKEPKHEPIESETLQERVAMMKELAMANPECMKFEARNQLLVDDQGTYCTATSFHLGCAACNIQFDPRYYKCNLKINVKRHFQSASHHNNMGKFGGVCSNNVNG